MNYSNMIEEKSLKKSFIVATLISTVIGTLTASMNLHDRIQDKRQQHQQKQLDDKQSREIKQLEDQVKKLQDGSSRRSREDQNSRSNSRSRRRRCRDDDDDNSDISDSFSRSIKQSKALIEHRYDDYVSKVGSNYARGDVITENKLQAQIIALQQTVINVLQDALMSGRGLTRYDIDKLVAAQQSARVGTLDALQDQYHRMHAARTEEPATGLLLESGHTLAPVQRQLNLPPQSEPAIAPVRRVKSLPVRSHGPFCAYSEDLQFDSSKSVSQAFSDTSDGRCPACGVRLQVDMNSNWVFTIPGEAEYSLSARFIVKCHTPDGGFACVICDRTRDVDCLCGNVQSLVRHLGRDHAVAEFDREEDFTRRS